MKQFVVLRFYMNCCPEDEHEDGDEWEEVREYMTQRRSIVSEVVDDKVEDSCDKDNSDGIGSLSK